MKPDDYPEPTPDRRLIEMDFDSVAHLDDEAEFHSITAVEVFAAAKYASRKSDGPRPDGQRPDDLAKAGALVAAGMAMGWRAGYRMTDVLRAAARAVKMPPCP